MFACSIQRATGAKWGVVDKMNWRDALPSMQNSTGQCVFLLAALLKCGNHTLNNLFKKQVSNTLVERIPKGKFNVKRQICLSAILHIFKLPIGDQVFKKCGIGDVNGDGTSRVKRNDAGVFLRENTEADGEVCDKNILVDNVGDVGLGTPGDKMVIVVDIGDYVVELGGREREDTAFEMMAGVLGSTTVGCVCVGSFGAGGMGRL